MIYDLRFELGTALRMQRSSLLRRRALGLWRLPNHNLSAVSHK
jgi:hypothetical protein